MPTWFWVEITPLVPHQATVAVVTLKRLLLIYVLALKDLIQRQSTLRWVQDGGEIQYSGRIVGYDVSTSAVAGGQEVASQNRLTMQVQLRYTHSLDPNLDFEKTFSRFADFPASSDLFDVETQLVEEINEQLTQEVFNASLGNW